MDGAIVQSALTMAQPSADAEMPSSIDALVFELRPHALVLAGFAARVAPMVAASWFLPVRRRHLRPPQLPGEDWVVLRPRYTGICGSDVFQAFVRADLDNPLSALVSFPHVMGHEIVAQVLRTGSAVRDLGDGAWVAIDPWLGCLARGLRPLCASCEAGHTPLCSRVSEPPPGGDGWGMHLGNVRDLPGGFSTLMVAHRSQCHPIPPGLDPAAAVLADPLAVGWHAVSRTQWTGDLAVVLGAGTVGLSVTAALRIQYPQATVITTAAWSHTSAAVSALGAIPCGVRPGSLVSEVARYTGARAVRSLLGKTWLVGGGVPLVIDAVGTAGTLDTALRIVAPRGQVVKVGVGQPGRLDSTLAYYKEVSIVGSNGYGWTETGGLRIHDLDRALDLLVAGRLPARQWLTHAYPMTAWRQAFATAARPGRTRAIKVTLRPTAAEPGEGPSGDRERTTALGARTSP